MQLISKLNIKALTDFQGTETLSGCVTKKVYIKFSNLQILANQTSVILFNVLFNVSQLGSFINSQLKIHFLFFSCNQTQYKLNSS